MADLPLADLDAFAAVARTLNFREAAKLRGVSASSLSDAVRRLEGRVGVRLLNRTTRSVVVTEAGQRLLEQLVPSLSGIEAALEAVNSFRDAPTGTLRLNVPTVIARAVLPPLACRFLKAHPGVTLEVRAEDTFIDVVAEGFDAGVRYDERLERDMIAIPIGPRIQRFVVAASPAYLEERGIPEDPHALLDHVSVRHRFASGMMPSWEFERDGKTVKVAPPPRLIANSIDLEIAAAVDGLGIIATFEEFLAPWLETGALRPLLMAWNPAFPGPFLYYASRRHMPAPLRAFVDFLKQENRATAA